MEITNDIDILLTLHEHGWSSAYFIVEQKLTEFPITHVFNNPYVETLEALSGLLRGRQEVSFLWYSEPGGVQIDISKIGDRVNLVGIEADFMDGVKEPEVEIDFQIELRQLIVLFYYQFKKTSILLQNSEYAKNRIVNFPYQEFHTFERMVLAYLK